MSIHEGFPEKQLPEHYAGLAPEYVDQLTGLPNRRWLDENLPQALEEYPNRVGLLFLDVDGLKKENDTKGHQAGDVILQNTGLIISRSLRQPSPERPGDMLLHTPVRLGGDEFVAVLLGVETEEGVTSAKDRIQEELQSEGIKTSIGSLLHKGETYAEFMEQADHLMMKDKLDRKLRSYTPHQQQTIWQLGVKATKDGINLRDLPLLYDFLRNQNGTLE
jgi:diguanylate cyclase (GGDEF)-like protein